MRLCVRRARSAWLRHVLLVLVCAGCGSSRPATAPRKETTTPVTPVDADGTHDKKPLPSSTASVPGEIGGDNAPEPPGIPPTSTKSDTGTTTKGTPPPPTTVPTPKPPPPSTGSKKPTVAPEPPSPPVKTLAMRIAEAEADFSSAQSAFNAAGNECASLCKALASMKRATEHLCELTQGGNTADQKRCTDAKAKLETAQAKVKATCGGCSG